MDIYLYNEHVEPVCKMLVYCLLISNNNSMIGGLGNQQVNMQDIYFSNSQVYLVYCSPVLVDNSTVAPTVVYRNTFRFKFGFVDRMCLWNFANLCLHKTCIILSVNKLINVYSSYTVVYTMYEPGFC